MTTFVLLGLMTLVILVLAALVIYLADRFNILEREAHDLMRKLQDAQARPTGPYAGLSGKALWDAVTGLETGNLDELTLDGVRKRYRLLLADHINWVFNEGVGDVAKAYDAVPTNVRTLRTPKAQVESWLPPEAVAEIYRCGQGYAVGDPDTLPGLAQRLDQVCNQLHVQCSLEPGQPASQLLMPPRAEAQTAGGAPASGGLTQIAAGGATVPGLALPGSASSPIPLSK